LGHRPASLAVVSSFSESDSEPCAASSSVTEWLESWWSRIETTRDPLPGSCPESGDLPQKTRQAPVLENTTARLALRAVVDRVLLEVDAGDGRAADVARLAELLVHAVDLCVLRAALSELEAAF